jgi:hypothetical protein
MIKNAIIESADINDGDRGLLTAWLNLSYGGSGQGFGGHVLYLPKSYSHHEVKSFAGHFIWRCMEIAGVSSWDKMKGKAIRVETDSANEYGGIIIGIGHITKDDWFYPSKDFV